MVGHFLPTGVTGLLRVFIPLIEILGVLIRPITLAVRLATNIRCGHVVLLMFGYFSLSYAFRLVVAVSVLIFALFIIELLVCLIQAYVF
jgi:F-type H+-transporting ATPase subunit a